MKSQEFIASGRLELYAAGALTPPEREEVEQMAALHPEVKAELNRISRTLGASPRFRAAPTHPHPRNQPITRFHLEEDAEAVPPTSSGPASVEDAPERLTGSEEEPQQGWEEGGPGIPSRRPTLQLALAGAVALLLLSGMSSFYFYQNWQRSENRLEAAQAREQQLAQTFRTLEAQYTQRNKDLAVVRDQLYVPVRLQGQEAASASSATVYWNAQVKEVFLDVQSLPAPPSGFQYQLWALHENQYLHAGLLPVDDEQLQYLQPMKGVTEAQAFAITLEPEGGSEQPTLEKMVLMGEV